MGQIVRACRYLNKKHTGSNMNHFLAISHQSDLGGLMLRTNDRRIQEKECTLNTI